MDLRGVLQTPRQPWRGVERVGPRRGAVPDRGGVQRRSSPHRSSMVEEGPTVLVASPADCRRSGATNAAFHKCPAVAAAPAGLSVRLPAATIAPAGLLLLVRTLDGDPPSHAVFISTRLRPRLDTCADRSQGSICRKSPAAQRTAVHLSPSDGFLTTSPPHGSASPSLDASRPDKGLRSRRGGRCLAVVLE